MKLTIKTALVLIVFGMFLGYIAGLFQIAAQKNHKANREAHYAAVR